MNTIKQKYTEPQTIVAEVELGGFMDTSVHVANQLFEVDRWVNEGTQELSLDWGTDVEVVDN